MFKQNYINIFENSGGKITVAYAANGDGAFNMEEVGFISVDKSDLHTLGSVLIALADSIVIKEASNEA